MIGFAGLVAHEGPRPVDHATVWTVGGIAMFLCLLLCGMLRHRWAAVALGWALQIALDRLRVRGPDDVLPRRGLRAPCGGPRVHYGRKVERLQAERLHAALVTAGRPPCSLGSPRVPGALVSQRTLVLLKPDAVRRGLIGEIIGRIERKAAGRSPRWSCARWTRTRWSSTTPSTRASPSTSRWWSSWPPVRSWPGRRGRAGHRGRPRAGRRDRPDRRRARLHPRRLSASSSGRT